MTVPSADLTVAGLLRARVDDHHPALLFEDEHYTWAEVVEAGGIRGRLALERRQPGPFHIGVLLENGPEYLFWIVAAALAGATVVGINPTRRGDELAHDIRHTDCQLIVTEDDQRSLLEGIDSGIDVDRFLWVDDPATARALEPHRGAGLPDVAVDAGDRLLLLFTSGSTGAPKAVVCTQGRLATIANHTPAMFGIDRDTVTYQAMPMFHGNALMANWAPVLGAGATMATRRRFSASAFLPDVRRYGASFFNYVGRSLAYVLATVELPDDADNPLRLGFGTEASARDMATFTERFGCALLENYGSSEGAISTNKPSDAPDQSIGRPAPHVDLAVVDPGTHHECPPARFGDHGQLINGDEAIGELVGRNVAGSFEGYYNNPEADADRMRNGWYWSGDLGYRDKDGWFYFAGRGGDWLRVDSENFAAAPIERIVSRYRPAVMVAVYPVPDPRTGDQVMAALEIQPGVDFDPRQFAEFLIEQPDLGTKWAPRFVRIVESMPLTASNKVQKHRLRSEGWETSDQVYWRPGRSISYEQLTAEHVVGLRAQFEEFGRLSMITRS